MTGLDTALQVVGLATFAAGLGWLICMALTGFVRSWWALLREGDQEGRSIALAAAAAIGGLLLLAAGAVLRNMP